MLCLLILYIKVYSRLRTTDFFRKLFMAIFICSQSFCQTSTERKSSKIFFSYFGLMSGLGPYTYIYWVRHLTCFFQLVLISWMVTLCSCLIWQIISFILPPNEYGCVYAWTPLGNIATDRVTKDVVFGNKRIIFSDEAYVDLGGYVNKQNCRIWGTENPHAYFENPTNPTRVTDRIFVHKNWQHLDGPTCHTAEATLYVLRPDFEDRIISRQR